MLRTVVLAALCVAALVSASASRPQLPNKFVVSIGTTLPFVDLDPVAQSGAIYFDRTTGQMRIDNFWLGAQRTFILDLQRQRAHIINEGTCITSIVKGKLLPVTIPEYAARDREVNTVRGVKVDHFHTVVKGDDLLHIDYYFRKSNYTLGVATDDDGDLSYWLPWRLTTRRVERQEMIAAPDRPNPNWRFFGEPITDEIVKYGPDGRALTRLMKDVIVTTDFYNFSPITPDPSVFEIPEALCKEAPTATHEDDIDVFETQRHMTELSFNNEAGHRILGQLFGEHDFMHEIADDNEQGEM
jgi:hypothetical protein